LLLEHNNPRANSSDYIFGLLAQEILLPGFGICNFVYPNWDDGGVVPGLEGEGVG